MTNSTNTAALQIYPPSAITQQVQQSVPALNVMPPTVMQNRPDYNVQRLQMSRTTNSRTKTYQNYLILELSKSIFFIFFAHGCAPNFYLSFQFLSFLFRTYPSLVPVTGRASNRQIANVSVVSDDGPTVRQHLQQQHRARLQQQLALQEKAKSDKVVPVSKNKSN